MSMSRVIPFLCVYPNRQVQKGPRCRKHDLDPKGKAGLSGSGKLGKVGFVQETPCSSYEWVDIPGYTMTITITISMTITMMCKLTQLVEEQNKKLP